MKRRGNREGSIFQRRDGRWCALLDLGRGEDGKRKRLTLYGTSRRDVQELLVARAHDRQCGMLPQPTRETVGENAERWLHDTVQHSVRPATAVSYGLVMRKHVIAELGPLPLQKLTPGHLRQLYAKKLQAGLSGASVQRIHAITRRWLGQAMKDGLVPRNVAAVVERPRAARKAMRVLTPSETAKLLQEAAQDRLAALYVLAVTSGMRQGELLGLAWGHVNLKAGQVQVCQQLQYIHGEPQLLEPKTAAGRRLIELPALAVRALSEHRVRQLKERLAVGDLWQDQWGLVFTGDLGRPLTASVLLKRSFVPLLERAELPRIRFHDLRHTAATLLLAAGEHPKVVQERLGHSSIALTLDTYSHVLPSMQKAAAAKIDAILIAASGLP
jgi:integrase